MIETQQNNFVKRDKQAAAATKNYTETSNVLDFQRMRLILNSSFKKQWRLGCN